MSFCVLEKKMKNTTDCSSFFSFLCDDDDDGEYDPRYEDDFDGFRKREKERRRERPSPRARALKSVFAFLRAALDDVNER